MQLALQNTLKDKDIEESNTKEKICANIFETYYQRVYNYIYYRTSSHDTAEELASQVFEKVILNINTYSEHKAPFEVWLFAIARNIISDHFRRQKKYKLFSLDSFRNLISKEKNPEGMVLAAETSNNLLMILQFLNDREKNIVGLKFGANLKNKEIGDILGLTENNVGVILYRTIKKLREKMEGEDQVE